MKCPEGCPKAVLEHTQINTVGRLLTALLFSCSCQQVVEDVEGPLLFSLTNSSRLLQQIWLHVSQEETPQSVHQNNVVPAAPQRHASNICFLH